MASDQESESRTLFFERSPYGHCDAVVETDGRAVYFYLSWPDEGRVAPCWVANLEPGPLSFDRRDLEANRPPLLPKPFCCKVPAEQQVTIVDEQVEAWSVLWDPAGQGAILFWREQWIAIIPPWTGQENFHGYARDCAVENLICHPAPPADTCSGWISAIQNYWQSWSLPGYFQAYQQLVLNWWQQAGPTEVAYFAIDGGRFPPRAISVFQKSDISGDTFAGSEKPSGQTRWPQQTGQWYTTVGLGLCPQPSANWSELPGQPSTRNELVLFVPEILTGTERDELLQQLGGLAAIPWKRNTCFRHGDTCELRWRGVLRRYRMETMDTPDLGEKLKQPVRLLLLTPVT